MFRLIFVLIFIATIAAGQQKSPSLSNQPDLNGGEKEEEQGINLKRQEWFWHQRMYPGSFIPPLPRSQAIQKLKLYRNRVRPEGEALSANLSASTWTSIGPQPIGTSPNPYAGRVYDIRVDPTNALVAYAGTDGGGVWKTTDGGFSWTSLTDFEAALSIQSLALDPLNPKIVYAGTGSSYYGAGILKTVDGGAHWSQIAGPFVTSTGWMGIASIAISPSNDQLLMVGTYWGIYKSTDGGSTWKQVWSVTGNAGNVHSIVFDSLNPERIYAAVDGPQGGVLGSSDDGQTWTSMNGGSGKSLPLSQAWEVGFAVANSDSKIMYVTLRSSASPPSLLGFYKSIDGGLSWNPMSAPTGDNPGYWRWTINVHPLNPNVLFAGLLGIYQSLDGGQTWTNTMQFSGQPHVDQHIQAFSADGGHLYAGNDGGVWSTATPTSNPFSWTNLNQTFSTVLFNPGFSLHPADITSTLAGTQDNGTLAYDGSLKWNEPRGGDGGFAAVDFQQPTTMYHTYQWPYGIEKSISGASGPWQSASIGVDINDNSAFYPPFVMDPGNSARLYFGTYRLYQSTDNAGHWTAVSGDLSAGSGLTAIAAAQSDGNVVFTGSCGQVFVSLNALSTPTWANVSKGLPNRCVNQIAIESQTATTAYVAFSGYSYWTPDQAGHLFRTVNAGATWTDVSGNLPDIPVNDVVIDPDSAHTLYVGTDAGVFRSVDGGSSWLPLGSGLPNIVVNAIRLHRPTRTLRAATWGRGMWDLSVALSGQVNVAVNANIRAPFSIGDGLTYYTPTTFLWTPGSSYTITWLSTGDPGTRYSFGGWADGGMNPRTITVPANAATYAANITAQYQLSTSSAPLTAGSIYTLPASVDGYYSASSTVQLHPVGANGYGFWYWSGDLDGVTSPASVVLNKPLGVTANFYCSLNFSQYLFGPVGPGPTTGKLEWTTGAGCSWAIDSSASWLTLSGSLSGVGSGSVMYSVASNEGASRSAEVHFSKNVNAVISLSQDASGSSRPSVVAVSPSSGSALTQAFSIQISDSSGYLNVNALGLTFDGSLCTLEYYRFGSQGYLYLSSDPGSPPLSGIPVPGTGTLTNSHCQVNGSQFSISGSGSVATFTIGMTFFPLFTGSHSILAYAGDVSGLYSPSHMYGVWTIGSACSGSINNGFQYGHALDQGGVFSASLEIGAACPWSASSNSPWITIESGAAGTGNGVVIFSVASNTSGEQRTGSIVVAGQTVVLTQDITPLEFVPVTPCRVADTRKANGPFGGPVMLPGQTREFDIPQSSCGIPTSAVAYSLNLTVVPTTALGFLSAWPAREFRPVVSTLNSDGRVKANAAIVPANFNGGIDAFVTDETHLIIDIDGYFTAHMASSLQFFPLTPCRMADTRLANGPLGGPFLSGNAVRTFPLLSSVCNIPSTAQAYSLNMTVVPHTALGYMTTWATGTTKPLVSTLNSSTGAIAANAAIVPAGANGSVDVFVTDDTDLIIDTNGYFAPGGSGGLSLYTLTPCRVLDTRLPAGRPPFNGTISASMQGPTCAVPSDAQSYVLNATVVPPGAGLGWLTLWPDGGPKPRASTLNAPDKAITSNMAIVSTLNGSLDIFASNPTYLILDILGYFAQ